jgi:hypothetical protein
LAKPAFVHLGPRFGVNQGWIAAGKRQNGQYQGEEAAFHVHHSIV